MMKRFGIVLTIVAVCSGWSVCEEVKASSEVPVVGTAVEGASCQSTEVKISEVQSQVSALSDTVTQLRSEAALHTESFSTLQLQFKELVALTQSLTSAIQQQSTQQAPAANVDSSASSAQLDDLRSHVTTTFAQDHDNNVKRFTEQQKWLSDKFESENRKIMDKFEQLQQAVSSSSQSTVSQLSSSLSSLSSASSSPSSALNDFVSDMQAFKLALQQQLAKQHAALQELVNATVGATTAASTAAARSLEAISAANTAATAANNAATAANNAATASNSAATTLASFVSSYQNSSLFQSLLSSTSSLSWSSLTWANVSAFLSHQWSVFLVRAQEFASAARSFLVRLASSASTSLWQNSHVWWAQFKQACVHLFTLLIQFYEDAKVQAPIQFQRVRDELLIPRLKLAQSWLVSQLLQLQFLPQQYHQLVAASIIGLGLFIAALIVLRLIAFALSLFVCLITCGYCCRGRKKADKNKPSAGAASDSSSNKRRKKKPAGAATSSAVASSTTTASTASGTSKETTEDE